MEATKLLRLDKAGLQKLAAEHGVELITDEEQKREFKEKREEEWHRSVVDDNFQKKMRFFDSISLWSGDEKIEFTFNDWDAAKQKDVQQAKDIGNQCFSLAKKMLTDNFNVMLMGKPGTGKTSLALAMLDAVHKKNKTTMFVSTMAFSLLLKKSFNDKNAKFQVEKVSNAMKRADVLLLDDFGTEGGMDGSPVYNELQSRLFDIADARIVKDKKTGKRLKSMILTTNNSFKELQQMYNEKILSRLIPHKAEQIVAFKNMEDVR